MQCVIGSPVSGKNLYGRKKEIQKIWTTINTSSIILVGPRRFGKTSLTREIFYYPREDWKVIYLDVESLKSPIDLITEITYKTTETPDIKQKICELFSTLRNSIDEIEIPELKIKLREQISIDWEDKGNKVFEKLTEDNNKIIIILDELPIMLQNMQTKNQDGCNLIKQFLQWLRNIRNNYEIRFILCGSIGLNHLLKKCDCLQTINDFFHLEIGPFDNNIAKGFIKELFRGSDIEVKDSVIDSILNKIGAAIPFFVQIFVSLIIDKINGNDSNEISERLIDQVYNEKILGVYGKNYLNYYLMRLNTYYSNDEQKIIKAILNLIAKKGESSFLELYNEYSRISKNPDETIFNDILEKLVDDFYIFKNNKHNYYFYSKIISDFWNRRFRQ